MERLLIDRIFDNTKQNFPGDYEFWNCNQTQSHFVSFSENSTQEIDIGVPIEDKKNGANIVINIPTDQCPHIYNTQCVFHLWININIKMLIQIFRILFSSND